jgi:hypothetical protein
MAENENVLRQGCLWWHVVTANLTVLVSAIKVLSVPFKRPGISMATHYFGYSWPMTFNGVISGFHHALIKAIFWHR